MCANVYVKGYDAATVNDFESEEVGRKKKRGRQGGDE